MSNKEYRPTLAQLRTFVTIAENRHFGTAAAKLSISQPSLSQALVALETGLGVQLIERSTRRVIVTPTGEELLPSAKATLDAAETFLAMARGASGSLTGPLTLGMIPTVAPYILPNLLHRVTSDLPDLQPCIIEDQTRHLVEQLRDGQIDCAVVALPVTGTGLTTIPLYDEDFAIVVPAPSPMAGREDVTLPELRKLNLLLLDDGHCLRDQIIDLCQSQDFSPTPQGPGTATTRAASLSTVMQCVAGGLGATLVPVSAVPSECDRPGLAVARFTDGVSARRTIGLAYRASSARREEFQQLGELIRGAYDDIVTDLAAPSGASPSTETSDNR
ncbi:hydrogen peroxide-inducible genes activator [Corynebacterium pygosceleis]|uniref:Probable hydrogen peroxide-inducible genes activator n=1 Tax=Corynebacterium pygosceleis TaxID=2800406 RepID=A0A9Q4GHR4_9CORY|nr:hydrogen peroxide-inducible genes activator [Corynebacterium pygosceleis]MCK7636875.1 hydrogen peroxide-inducible genes activator [Corynebacterium pygosceleis]MCK7674349.1 hydrogen peroxide-inducible genes activator [Corynebacterium pygosceleis]MCL0120353.1 hydrogen peroxide-inducible genes activator [Corynebacterium pygosceleis]MCX7467628.1 hydrogen peroxide-inducible genes activator [Corynebacterium pygosceleis]